MHLQEGDPEGWWEETFKGHTDSKPKGPHAMSVDLEFPGAQHVYGLPERATNLSLEATAGDCYTTLPMFVQLHQLHDCMGAVLQL
jgi:hypothetical protein